MIIGETPLPSGPLGVDAVNMTMRFGDFVALDEVELKVRPGSFHALLGENGAGKSTLVKCIMGYYHPTARRRAGRRPRTGDRQSQGRPCARPWHGVPALHPGACDDGSREPGAGARRRSRGRELGQGKAGLEAFLGRMPFKVPLNAKVSDISAGERQKCEILKQLYLKRRFLILDEPTSVLTPGEADEVLGMLRAMVIDDGLTILMITHKFREVMAFADEVTILRRGKLAGHGKVADLTPDSMARMMIGAEELTLQPPRVGEVGETRLELDKLNALDDAGAVAVHDVSLAVRGGEIVGIAGVSGNGQRQLVEVLAGQRQAESGAIRVIGDPYHATREEMRRHKMSLLPEEPLKNACVGGMSVADNIAFREFDRAPFASGGWWLNRAAFRSDAEKKIGLYKIKTRTPDTPISALSGGNVQRTVLARELGGDVEVLIAANPCFGLDFAAVAQIHAEIMAARNRGAAVLLVSEDLDELLELSDRLVVMFHGQLVYEARASEADLTEIGRHMAGH